MIWSDQVKEFEAPSGKRIVVNTAGEAWCLRDVSGSTLRRAVEATFSYLGRHTRASWRDNCLDVPDTGDSDDAIRWLSGCLKMPTGNPNTPFAVPMRLLAELRREGALLWPSATGWMPHPCLLASPDGKFKLVHGKTGFENRLIGQLGQERKVASSLLMACSPVYSEEDLAEGALLATMEAAARSSVRPHKSSFHLLALARQLEGWVRKDGTVVTVVEAGERLLRELGARGKALPRYGLAAERLGADVWVERFHIMSADAALKMGGDQDAAHGRWLEYLDSLGTIPAPSDIRRDLHIKGLQGFLAWLQKFHSANSVQYGVYVQFLREMFDALHDEGEMPANPILDCDVPRNTPRNNKSDKPEIPRELLEMIVEIVSDLADHAFDQFAALSDGQSWAPAGSAALGGKRDDADLVPATVLKPRLFRSLGVTLRGSDQSVVRVLNPILPVSILWLAKVPNRNIEARMADSGEADELIPDVSIESSPEDFDRVRAVLRPNRHPLAQRGRRQGAIRLIEEGGREVVGLYATINKSQPGGHKDGADRGREIPWEDPQLHMALYKTRLWQEFINPVDKLLSRDQLRDRKMQPSDGLRGKLAGYAYLFRHLQDTDLSGRLEPVTYLQLHAFFMCVLDEAEARMEARRLRAANGRLAVIPLIVLARDEAGRPARCAYTLHCTRVTGLTALARAKVPFWIISKIVGGHCTLQMTLLYIKVTSVEVVDALGVLRRDMEDGALEREADEASTWSDAELERRLVHDGPSASGNGNQIAGFWRPAADGICPNGATQCHQGGPVLEGKKVHGPVQGGAQNCALCRFFVTGPRFIAGQVAWFNATLFKARRQAEGMRALWVERRIPGNESRRAWYDDRIARAEAEFNLTALALGARHRRIMKSVELARLDEAGLARTDGVPQEGDLLLTRMTPGEVAVNLREVSELGFIDEVARVAALIPEAEVPEARMQIGLLVDRLLDRDGFEAITYRLPGAMATLAAMAMVDGVRSQAPPGVKPAQFLDDVAEGRIRLFDLDMRAIEAEVSRAAGRPIRVVLSPSRGGDLGPDLLPAPPDGPGPLS